MSASSRCPRVRRRTAADAAAHKCMALRGGRWASCAETSVRCSSASEPHREISAVSRCPAPTAARLAAAAAAPSTGPRIAAAAAASTGPRLAIVAPSPVPPAVLVHWLGFTDPGPAAGFNDDNDEGGAPSAAPAAAAPPARAYV